MVHNLHESIQRPWDVGSLLGEDAFPDPERLLWSVCPGETTFMDGGEVWLWSSLQKLLDSCHAKEGSRVLYVRARRELGIFSHHKSGNRGL